MHDYSTRLLGLGCFYLVYCDAIREGARERVFNVGDISFRYSKIPEEKIIP